MDSSWPTGARRLVFITAHERFAVKAFEVQALDYLLKPVDRARFDQVLSRMKRRLRQEQPAVTATPREFPARILIDTGARSLFSGPGKDRARTDGTELPCDSQRRRCAPSAGHAGCVCRAARSGAISAHQPFRSGECGCHRRDAALVPRREHCADEGRDRTAVDAAVLARSSRRCAR